MALRLYGMTCGHLDALAALFLNGEAGRLVVPVSAYLIEHPKGTAVFDTGMAAVLQDADEEVQKRELDMIASVVKVRYGRGEDVAARLEASGRDPAKIDFLISSHLHFDHVGGNRLIPNARWIVQKREWQAACGPESARYFLDGKNLNPGHQRIEADGEHDVFGDGSVVCLPTYGHTPGHQSLRLRLDGGDVILTADACYMRRALEEMRLPGLAPIEPQAARAHMRRFGELERAGARLVFGHDPEAWAGLNEGPVREITWESLRQAAAPKRAL